jgi:hypothetical protein
MKAYPISEPLIQPLHKDKAKKKRAKKKKCLSYFLSAIIRIRSLTASRFFEEEKVVYKFLLEFCSNPLPVILDYSL